MVHEKHGATHVTSSEVEEHEKNGWNKSTYSEWMSKKKQVEIEPVRNKPGRKPKGQ